MILDFRGMKPKIDPTVFIADNALVIGDVELGAKANVWFFCLVRGDVQPIRVGANCNIQDGCILHVASNGFPLVLEDDVVLGHRVTAHGCHIERGAFIGIGATILNGARIGEETIVGAGSVVTSGTVIPPRSLALGTPARAVRELTEKDFAMIHRTRNNYLNLMEIYKEIPLTTKAVSAFSDGA
ncbi:MAG: gamma carbonic anhydrase family protein [Syntrophus sp. (in: bacteria)]|nr:gamma carbonic anhydrase family protein [Syntrophus sp. (in: bacteria)]